MCFLQKPDLFDLTDNSPRSMTLIPSWEHYRNPSANHFIYVFALAPCVLIDILTFFTGSIQQKLDTSITSRAESHLKMVILTQACKTTLCHLFLLVNLVRFNVFTFLELFLHAFSHANIFIAHVLI